MKKKVSIIVIICFLVILITTISLLYFTKKNKLENQEESKVIVKADSIYTIDNTIYLGDSNKYFYMKEDHENETQTVYRLDGTEILNHEDTANYVLKLYDEYILKMTLGEEWTLKTIYDKDGNIVKDNLEWWLEYDENSDYFYFLDINNDIVTLYDKKFHELVKSSFKNDCFYLSYNVLSDNYLKVCNNIIDIKNKKNLGTFKTTKYDSLGDYYIFTDSNTKKTYLFNLKEGTIDTSYTSYKAHYTDDMDQPTLEYIELYKKKERFILVNNKIIEDQDQLTDTLYADYSLCKEGAKLIDFFDDVDDICHLRYEKVSDNIIIGITDINHNNGVDLSDDIYINNKHINDDYKIYATVYPENQKVVVTNNSYYAYKDDYKYNDDENIVRIYDFNGNRLSNQIHYNLYKTENYYYDSNKQRVLDNRYNPVFTEYDIQNFYCYDKYCYLNTKNDKYYLIIDGKIINYQFNNISFVNDTIILRTPYTTYIVIPGDKDIELNTALYNDIKTDEIINKYNLNNIQDTINNNQTLFKKYAYIIENNKDIPKELRIDNLSNSALPIKNYLYSLFPIIVKYEKYLDESKFFYSLTNLSIYKDEYFEQKYTDSAIGKYIRYNNEIAFSNTYRLEKSTVYHELFHFLDIEIGIHDQEIYIYNNKITTDNEYIDKKATKYTIPESYLMLEAGAEYFSDKNYKTREDEEDSYSYIFAIKYLKALIYIYGEDTMEDIFFSPNTEIELAQLYLDAGFTFNEYLDINQKFNKVTYPSNYPNMEYPTSPQLSEHLLKLYDARYPKPDKKHKDEFNKLIDEFFYS